MIHNNDNESTGRIIARALFNTAIVIAIMFAAVFALAALTLGVK